MSPQDFLILNSAVAVIIGLVFLRARKRKRPSRLKFSQGPRPSGSVANPEFSAPADYDEDTGEGKSYNLNVMFNYNGHSWDAYEVLGVPAGSSLAAVEKAFNRSLKGTKRDTEEFLRVAYESILADRKNARRE